MGAALDALAPRFPATKFLRIVSTDCIPGYPDGNLPTVLLYHGGKCLTTLVGLMPYGGRSTTPERAPLPPRTRALYSSSRPRTLPWAAPFFNSQLVQQSTVVLLSCIRTAPSFVHLWSRHCLSVLKLCLMFMYASDGSHNRCISQYPAVLTLLRSSHTCGYTSCCRMRRRGGLFIQSTWTLLQSCRGGTERSWPGGYQGLGSAPR